MCSQPETSAVQNDVCLRGSRAQLTWLPSLEVPVGGEASPGVFSPSSSSMTQAWAEGRLTVMK
jgi:hypothetical protein